MSANPPAAVTPRIYVRTGLPDDPRRPLAERDGPLYWAARDVHDRQDEWSPEEHAAAWTVLLASWPIDLGRPPHADALSVSAALLAREGIDPSEALVVSPDTLRERGERAPTQRERTRPSVRRGEELLHAGEHPLPDVVELSTGPPKRDGERDAYVIAVRRANGELWVPEDARPRVYLDGEDEPDGGYVNPLVRIVPGAHRMSAAAETYARRAEDARRARWRRP